MKEKTNEGNGSNGTRSWTTWWSMRGNRWIIGSLMAGGIFVLLVLVGWVDPTPLREIVGKKDPIETLFNALVGGIITGVTLVLTINQLVLSQELGAVNDQRQRMDGAMDFIRHVESLLEESVSPTGPASFLRSLLEGIRDGARSLSDTSKQQLGMKSREQIQTYVDSLKAETEATRRHLEESEFGTFNVISAALQFDYSKALHEARVLRESLDEEIGDGMEDCFDHLTQLLQTYGPTREHFKTLYFQWELINLSKAIIYTGVPALIISCGTILFLDDTMTITGKTLGVNNLNLSLSLLTTLSIYPFLMLVSYVLRIATVTKKTLAMGPFTLLERDGSKFGRGD